MHRTDTCIFCGEQGELTGEHLWSDWMTPAFAPKKRDRNFIHVRRMKDGNQRSFAKRAIDVKFKLLCHRCNHETLGRLENEFFKPLVKPMMLSGRSQRLTLEDNVTLAVWAFKTLVISDFAYNGSPFFYREDERRAFIETMTPPIENFRVWLFEYRSASGGPEGHVAPMNLRTGGDSLRPAPLRQFTLTFIAGHFGFQAQALSGEDGELTSLVPEPSEWANRTVQVWPSPESDVLWPPQRQVRSSQYDAFVTRFGGNAPR